MSLDTSAIKLQNNSFLLDSLPLHSYQDSLRDTTKMIAEGSNNAKDHFLSTQYFDGHFNYIEKPNENQNWISGIIIIAFILLAVTRIAFRKRLGEVFRAFLRRSYTNQLTREGNLFKDQISIPLFLIFSMSTSLLLFHSFILIFPEQSILKRDIILFTYINIGVILFFLLQILFIRFTSLVFNTNQPSFEVSLVIFISNLVSGIIILPLVSLYHYSHLNLFLILAIIIFVFIFIYRFIRIFSIGISYSVFSNLYLFLYLCTLEILPIVIVSKLVINYVMP